MIVLAVSFQTHRYLVDTNFGKMHLHVFVYPQLELLLELISILCVDIIE